MADTFRKEYRALTDEEKKSMETLKTTADELYNQFTLLTPPGREQSLAKTKLEESVMWAIKSITG